MSRPIEPFRSRLREALASTSLPVALGRTLPQLDGRRRDAFADRDFELGQQDLATRRAAAVRELPQLLEHFTQAAEKAGATVHAPASGRDAVETVIEILNAHEARLVVKTKSMASEEIGLNAGLESAGIEAVETDLGEFLVQQAGERPSHIIAPALHITRERAAEIISSATGETLPADPDVLVGAVRRHLRTKFIEADAGITGANALIAETGTVMLVSNEGNVRLSSSLPPVHIVVAGIDKLVPSMADATAILEMLPRAATGQPISSYVSFVTGPSRSADIELSLSLGVHGPREVHIVLLDNGRGAMRQDPVLSEALQCVRCGACSNICPVYQQVGGHAMGYIYTGPIGLVLTPFHHGIENAAGPASLCAGCGACASVCPAGIALPDLIVTVREQSHKSGATRSRTKELALRVLANEWAYEASARAVARMPMLQALAHRLPGSPARRRPLPTVTRQPLRDRICNLAGRPSKTRKARVAYFPGCLTDWTAPEIGVAAIKVLRQAGAEVIPVVFRSCCGLPAINSGDREPAIQMAKQTILAFEDTDVDWIVSTSTSCVHAVLHDYQRILQGEPEWRERASSVARKTIDFARCLVQLGMPDVQTQGRQRSVVVHDACQSKHGLGLHTEARQLLEAACYSVHEAADSGECCGFGGTFSLDHPEVARRMRRRKLEAYRETGAMTICGDNPGCLLHFRTGERLDGLPRIAHLAELLAEALPEC